MAEETLDQQTPLHAVANRLTGASAAPGRYLFGMLLVDIASGTTTLPSPDAAIALQIQRGVQMAQHGRRIARLLAADPAMSAKALRAACADAKLRRPRSLPVVVERLGRHYTTGLVNRCASAELMFYPNDSLRRCARDAWQRALRVSTISYLLAILDGRFDPEEAMLAGLLHNLGEFALIGRASRERRPDIEAELLAALQHYSAESGRELARNWGFPASLQRVCNAYNDWYRDHDGDADVADLVMVAQLHARLGQRSARRLPSLERIPAFAKLDLGKTSPRFSLQLLEAANNALALTQRQLANT